MDSVVVQNPVNTFNDANTVHMNAVELRISPLLALT